MDQTNEADDLLERHRAGDASARDGLIRLAQGRFVALARAMLRRYPHVRRWEQTDDLLQAALMRLHRSLAEVRPETVRHFDNLAATQIRRELIDLARSYHGPEGLGANHHTDGTDPGGRLAQVADGVGQARDAGGVGGLPRGGGSAARGGAARSFGPALVSGDDPRPGRRGAGRGDQDRPAAVGLGPAADPGRPGRRAPPGRMRGDDDDEP